MSLINYVINDKFIYVEHFNASLMQESNYLTPKSLEISISNPSKSPSLYTLSFLILIQLQNILKL